MSDHDTTKNIELPGGRSMALADDQRAIHIADQHGEIEIEIELRDTGPVVRVRAAALQVETRGELALGCERFEVRAREGIRLASNGDLLASAGGDLDMRASGHAHCEGKSVRIRARTGEAEIEARDDVRLDGERVLLNSDT